MISIAGWRLLNLALEHVVGIECVSYIQQVDSLRKWGTLYRRNVLFSAIRGEWLRIWSSMTLLRWTS